MRQVGSLNIQKKLHFDKLCRDAKIQNFAVSILIYLENPVAQG